MPVCPAQIAADLLKRIGAVARQAWDALASGEGYGRVDLRVDDEGQPCVLEVNPNPDLSSDAGLARMGRAVGWDYDELVLQVVEEALKRARRALAAAAARCRAHHRRDASPPWRCCVPSPPADRGRRSRR